MSSLTNVVAERAVLGAIIKSPQTFWQVQPLLRSDFFSTPLHQRVYATIESIMVGGQTLSLTLLGSRLGDEEDEGGTPVTTHMAVWLHDAQDIGSPMDFAGDVAELAALRSLDRLGEEIRKLVRKRERPSIDIAAEAESRIIDVRQVASPRRPRLLSDVADTLLASTRSAHDSDVLPGCNTGLMPVDEILGTMLGGDLGFILGSQGDGKSALAAQIGVHVSSARPVLMVQLEMTTDQVAAREVAAASGVTVERIFDGGCDFAEFDRLTEARKELKKRQFWIHDDKRMTVSQLRALAMGMKRSTGLGMLIVDQLDKLKVDVRTRDKFERLAEATAELKDLAKELNVPVIVLAQRTRTAQRRDDPTPMINDADAPSIERDGDWVLAVWRRESWLRQNRPMEKAGGEAFDKWKAEIRRAENVASVICLKRRRGKPFQECELKWNGSLTRFAEFQ